MRVRKQLFKKTGTFNEIQDHINDKAIDRHNVLSFARLTPQVTSNVRYELVYFEMVEIDPPPVPPEVVKKYLNVGITTEEAIENITTNMRVLNEQGKLKNVSPELYNQLNRESLPGEND